MFAKEIFDYPELEEHPLLCNHLGKHNNNKIIKKEEEKRAKVEEKDKEASSAWQSFR